MAKDQLDLNLAIAVKDNKNISISTRISKSGLRRNLHSLLDVVRNIDKDKLKAEILHDFFVSSVFNSQ